MAFYLALDAGGTKTEYLLADDTRELARLRSGTLKLLRTDAPTAAANLDSALAQLSALACISMDRITRTCIGAAGHTVPLVADWLRESLTSRISGELILLSDVEIALDAAFHGGPGILVLAGTGSNVAARTLDGSLITAGGWGPALADQGSGHRIGLEALRAAFLAKDEGRPTLLLDAILEFWQLASLAHLVEHANRQPPPDFSRLTEVVLHCANHADDVAATVLRQQGEDLAWLVRLLVRRMQSTSSATSRPPALPTIAFAGSIMEKVPPVRDALIAAVHHEFPTIHTLDGVIDPIAGALWRARS